MNERLKETFQGQSPAIWENGKMAYMRYKSANIWYQVAGLHYEGTTLYYDHDEIAGLNDIVKFPIIAQGITAYILRWLGIAEDKIYSDYYQTCLSKFILIENKKPGSFKRNLDSEFYTIHLREENEKIYKSELLFSYLTKDESDVIREFVNYYFDFIKKQYGPNENISVPVWALYYHYLIKAKVIPDVHNQHSSVDDSIRIMIQNDGHLFSFNNFRNVFYAIGNGNEKDPLKPSTLEKAIVLLEPFPLAKNIAKNDLYSYTNGVTKSKYK